MAFLFRFHYSQERNALLYLFNKAQQVNVRNGIKNKTKIHQRFGQSTTSFHHGAQQDTTVSIVF